MIRVDHEAEIAEEPGSTEYVVLGLLLFLLLSFINLWNRVLTAERTMREHILRVEYRLAKTDRSTR